MNISSDIKSKYKDLLFDEDSHTYTHKQHNLTPVSNVVHTFVEKFDTEGISERFALKHNKNQNSVKKDWADNAQRACDFGTKVHNFGEKYATLRYFKQGNHNSLIPSSGQEKAVIKYWNELPKHIIPVVLELQMYSVTFGYAGTADILLYNTTTKKFIIADYKTNKDIFKNFANNTMLAPFDNMLDMPYNHYQLQLSLYQILLEEQGYEVEANVLIWLLPNGNYQQYKTKNFTNILKEQLQNKLEKKEIIVLEGSGY